MAGFYNPMSPKPQWGEGIQELLGNIADMIARKRGQGGQQQPGSQSPMMGPGGPGGAPMQQGPQQMQQPPQSPMTPPRPQPGIQGPSAQQGNSILSPQDIQMLSSQMPPELMQIILKLLGEGKFPQPAMGGTPGR